MDEAAALRPFEDLNELLTRPAHLAAFMEYLIAHGHEDAMVRIFILRASSLALLSLR